MSTVLEIQKEHRAGLYDSATGKTLATEKVVDVSRDCPAIVPPDRLLLLYTRAQRGRIVQITSPYEGEVYMGSGVHFFIDEIASDNDPRDDPFLGWARRVGLTRDGFLALIKVNAPD